jgi:hypothetical protein
MRPEAVRGRTLVGEDSGKGSQCARRRQNLASAGRLSGIWHYFGQPLVHLDFVIAAVSLALAARMGYLVHARERGPE